MSNLLLSLLTFVAYGVLAAYFWRAHVRGDGDLLSRGAIGHLVLIPLAMHGYLLIQDIFSGGGFDLGVLHALSLIVWPVSYTHLMLEKLALLKIAFCKAPALSSAASACLRAVLSVPISR